MKIGDKVRVKGIRRIGYITAITPEGFVNIDLLKNYEQIMGYSNNRFMAINESMLELVNDKKNTIKEKIL